MSKLLGRPLLLLSILAVGQATPAAAQSETPSKAPTEAPAAAPAAAPTDEPKGDSTGDAPADASKGEGGNPAADATPPLPDAPNSDAPAAPVPAPVAVDVDKLRLQLKEELKAELKQEMQADLEAAAKDAASQSAAEAEWEEERWVEEVRPKLNFLELNGYFRSRLDYMRGFDLGTYDPVLGRGTSSVPPPILYRPFDGFPGCEENGTPDDFPGQVCEATEEDTQSLVSMNMRFRLEPTLNVSEDIRIKGTVDIFDNLVMGSTPEAKPGFANNPTLPLPFFSAN